MENTLVVVRLWLGAGRRRLRLVLARLGGACSGEAKPLADKFLDIFLDQLAADHPRFFGEHVAGLVELRRLKKMLKGEPHLRVSLHVWR